MTLVVVGLFWWIMRYEGPLESTPTGTVSLSSGTTLAAGRKSIEDAFREKDPSWTICVHPSVERNALERQFNGGGNGLVIFYLAEAFRCRCVYNVKAKTVSFLPLADGLKSGTTGIHGEDSGQ